MTDTNNTNQVLIFDTTLRDGEQSPGCSMTRSEKLRVARTLAALNVDIIEAGFPIASQGDFEAVQAIAREIEGPTITGLARCTAGDIDRAWEAVKDAAKPRIHTFLATSPLHRQYKLKMSKEQIIAKIREGVSRAKAHCDDVEFSPEDGSRTELDYLVEAVETAIEAGATTINIPDTVGYAVPSESRAMFEYVIKHARGAENVVFSAHCHDDLGLATANSLAAVQGGARQVECTINGIGERAGNCPLEEVVMAIRARHNELGVNTNINTQNLVPASRQVSLITGSTVPRNKAIVGENAFAHESGIHQHGVLSERTTYEIIDPKDVGREQNNIVVGKHSGKHAIKSRLEQLGHHLEEDEIDEVVQRVKELGDRKKEIYDADLEAILLEQDPLEAGPFQLGSMNISTDSEGSGSATVRVTNIETSENITEAAVGDGPVHAVFAAITRATDIKLKLLEFRVQSVTIGADAQGEAVVDVRFGPERLRGRGISTDILEATALAVLDVVNRIKRRAEKDEATVNVMSVPLRD